MALADPDTASLPDLESLQRELENLMSGLGRTHEKIAQVAMEADRRNAELREKIIELESLNLDRMVTIQDLEMENLELRRQLEEGHPSEEWDRLVKERDQALEDKEKARKVGQELLSAVRQLEAQAKRCTCAAARAASTSSSSSNTTRAGRDNWRFAERQQPTAVASEEGPATHPHPSRATTPTPGALVRWNQNDSGSATSGSSQSLGSNGSLSTQSSWDTPSSASRAIAKANQAWYLEFAKAPGTAPMSRGPIPFEYLAEQLMLNEETKRAVTECVHDVVVCCSLGKLNVA
ncbi:hypothetical protein C8Q73DRAFT_516775 [Cubamyces lactineus]|nr:hypothetical protein C8Q73DRAFT_516775 [Cubamyces lactineus]